MEYVDYYDLYTDIKEKIKDMESEDQFNELVLLTCILIYDLSCDGKHLEEVLEMLNEFNYKKNFYVDRDESEENKEVE